MAAGEIGVPGLHATEHVAKEIRTDTGTAIAQFLIQVVKIVQEMDSIQINTKDKIITSTSSTKYRVKYVTLKHVQVDIESLAFILTFFYKKPFLTMIRC